MDISTIYVVGTGAAALVEVCQCSGAYTGIKITALITYHNNDCSLCFQTFSSTSQEVIHIEYVAMIQKNDVETNRLVSSPLIRSMCDRLQ